MFLRHRTSLYRIRRALLAAAKRERLCSSSVERTIYRIVTEAEWEAARAAGVFAGSDHDRRDGFIHFSTAEQVQETAEKHYAGRTGLLLLSVDADAVAGSLKWEVSRGGALFPHLYGTLPASAVREAVPLTRSFPPGARGPGGA
jgi:uncharacterized protein (DUF952 family)